MESQVIPQNSYGISGKTASLDSTNVSNPAGVESAEKGAKDESLQELNKAADLEAIDSKKEPLSIDELTKVAQQLQDFVSGMNKTLEFSVHEDSGRNVIKVIDKDSGDLVKQYPSEEVLDIVSKLAKATGTLVDYKV
jgi:flagellar protein FlaG